MSTTTPSISLEQIRIASPCSARWEDMTGDDRSRHCAECNLQVHNIAAMTRAEAEALLAQATEGRVCARLYRRADGTILTRECPVGLARIRAGMLRTAGRIAAALGLVAVTAATANGLQHEHAIGSRLRSWQPFAAISKYLLPNAPALPPFGTTCVAGSLDIAPPRASTGSSSGTGGR